MRVIEPSQLKRRSIKKKKKPVVPILLMLLFAGISLYIWKNVLPKKIDNKKTTIVNTSSEIKADTIAQKTKLKEFSNTEFVKFYSTFAYPNTSEILTAPVITGNAEADKRIQSLAEERGYRLRSAPIVQPVSVVDGYLIQQKAQKPLTDLLAEAKKLGMTITLTAAFRSVDEQRELFLSRLVAKPTDIANGNADTSVNETLKVTAPPGYSRHHNGFTIDIACGDVGGIALLQTNCYSWLSKDNFKNAKEYGWIPSYPEGASSVGPEPEPWEFVWVGRDALLE